MKYLTLWTNKKADQSNMKDINNILVDEACRKCGEAEDTDHMILECNYYSKNFGLVFNNSLAKHNWKQKESNQTFWKKISTMNRILGLLQLQ